MRRGAGKGGGEGGRVRARPRPRLMKKKCNFFGGKTPAGELDQLIITRREI